MFDRNSMAAPAYRWRRFWCPRQGHIVLTGGGFLLDPETEHGHLYNRDVVPFERIHEKPCLVLLGEPGIGKTIALEQHRAELEARLSDAGEQLVWKNLNAYQSDLLLVRSVFEDTAVKSWAQGSGVLHLFLDSFDECLIRIDSLASLLGEELKKLPVSRLRLRVACRTAVWPDLLEEHLKQLWGDEPVGVYELAPLRVKDVAEAAALEGIDSDTFLAEVDRREAAPLAGKPITLRFLLNTCRRGGGFPKTQAELYLQGCERLCEETSASRRAAGRLGSLSARQRLAVAGRIAAVSILCARPTICTGVDAGDLAGGEVSVREMIGGSETVDREEVVVTEAAVREVLDTGLFSARGPERLGFAHQTYAEFLAAQYLSTRGMDLPQMLSLVTCSADGQSRVVPQLQETSAWLASLDPSVFERLLQSDPQVLLSSDVATMSAAAREALVGAVLRLFDAGCLIDNQFGLRAKFRKLTHPRIAPQVQPYINDRAKNRVVRRVAIDIAEACGIRDLQGLLADLALDGTDDLHIREQAAAAVCRIADSDTKRRLRPCVAGTADDVEDSLKGWALHALWPDDLKAEEVFAALTLPKRRSLIGAYSLFVSGPLTEHLALADLPAALRWVAEQPARHDPEYPFRNVVNHLLRAAWQQMDAPGVLEPYAASIAKRLANYLPVPGMRSADETDEDRSKRYRLVEAVVPIFVQSSIDPAALVFTQTPLLSPGDLPWLIERLRTATSGSFEAFWLKVIRAAYRGETPEEVDMLLEGARACPALRNEFRDLLEPVALASPQAQSMRENYRRRLQWEENLQRERVVLQPPPRERIAVLLEQSEQGDLDAWWKLNMELTLEPTSTHYGDELESNLTDLPGWQAADAMTRRRIVEAAKRHLLGAQPSVGEWLGKSVLYRPDFAGYRALRLIVQEQPDFLESVTADVWQRWAQVIVGYPSRDDEPQQELVECAYRHASGVVIAALLVLIDKENRDHDWIFVHGKVARCWDAQLAAALAAKARDPDMKPSCMGTLLKPLLEHHVADAKQFAESLVTVPVPPDGAARKRAVVAASMLLTHAEDGGWATVWPAIQADTAFGRDVILAVADRHDQQHAALLTQHLTEEQIADLYLWIARQFPHAQDPHHDGAHTVGPRESAAHFRDAVLRQLQSRGSLRACRAMEQLARELPELSWLRWAVVETRELTLRRTWLPVQPDVLLRMVRDRSLRLVESGEQLLEVVIESLRRLEQNLQGEIPAAPDLWDRASDKASQPKDEEHLSNYIARHLRQDLQQRGIVANREVEIRRGEGDAQGERTDIHIDAIARGAHPEKYSTISAVVEVKGCWNQGLKKDMQAQLRDRYLKESQCCHGLYVVGWFVCPQWYRSDNRKQRTPKMTLQEARQYFDQQAVMLSGGSITMRAFVLNTAMR